jgi:WXG100 family type VII secretion target
VTSDRFRVDLDHLRDVVSRLDREHARLVAVAERLSAEVARLHDDWDGAAATAHEVAQEQWARGFGAMRAALAAMWTAGDTARGNYSDAASANVTMWRRVG